MSHLTHYIAVLAENHADAISEAENHVNEFFETYGTVQSAVCLFDNPDIGAVCSEVEEFLRVTYGQHGKDAVAAMKRMVGGSFRDMSYSDWFSLKTFASAGMEGVLNENGAFCYSLLTEGRSVRECFAGQVAEGVTVANYGSQLGDVRTTDNGLTVWLVKVSLHY